MILTNDFSNSVLQTDSNNNRSSPELCFTNIDNIVLEKSDAQGTLDILVEKARANTDEENCKTYLIYIDIFS